MKLRVVYEKGDRVRFLGHLDVGRNLRMAFVRANWPLLMSKGFSPRPKMAFYSPLPVGTAGFNEIVDVELSEDMSIENLSESLSQKLPQGFALVSLERIEESQGSLEPLITASCYCVDMGSFDEGFLRDSLTAFGEESSVMFTEHGHRRERTLDLKPFLLEWKISGSFLCLRLAHFKGRTIRPAWIIESLEQFGFVCNPQEVITDRRKIIFDS